VTVAQVSRAAGFSSIRQFNDTKREMFGMSPSRLRAAMKHATKRPASAIRCAG
jgi:AraC family transcriptional regulator, regulatory protein of adaptative response / DNA-3-methyladenine glycosylase II